MSKAENDIIRLLKKYDKERLTREKKLADELLRIYEECRKDLYIKFLEAQSGKDTVKIQHIEGTIRDIEKQMKYYTNLTAKARQAAIDEAFLVGQEFGADVLAAGGVNVSVKASIGLINRAMVESLMGDIPKLAGKVEQDVLFRIRDELTRGAVMGESIPKIAKRILGTGLTQEGMKKPFKTLQTRCEVIARTEIIKASDAGYEDLAIKAQQDLGEEIYDAWITAADSRVDEHCRAIANGTNPTYKSIDDHPGVYKRGQGPRPVISTHPRCRCRRIPYLLSWEESGELSSISELKGREGRSESNKNITTPKPVQEVEIERLLQNAPLQDRKKLAKHLLAESGNNIPVRVIKMTNANGYHSFTINANNSVKSNELALRSDDIRPYSYQIKTVFHEVTHARANGTVSDVLKIGDHAHRDFEETVAETVAHYMTKKAGITEEIVPSYASKLVVNLPKLKRLPEFSNCKKIEDFGGVLAKYRYDKPTSQWEKYTTYLAKEELDIVKYSKSYKAYVINNINEIVELIVEAEGATNLSVKSKEAIANRIIKAWENEDSNSSTYYVSLVIAMNRIGVI